MKFAMQQFSVLGVMEQTTRHNMTEVDSFFENLEGIFAKDYFPKARLLDVIRE